MSKSNHLVLQRQGRKVGIPWHWLLRVDSEISENLVTLVFSGSEIGLETSEADKLFSGILAGNVHTIVERGVLPLPDEESCFPVDKVNFTFDDAPE